MVTFWNVKEVRVVSSLVHNGIVNAVAWLLRSWGKGLLCAYDDGCISTWKVDGTFLPVRGLKDKFNELLPAFDSCGPQGHPSTALIVNREGTLLVATAQGECRLFEISIGEFTFRIIFFKKSTTMFYQTDFVAVG